MLKLDTDISTHQVIFIRLLNTEGNSNILQSAGLRYESVTSSRAIEML